MSVCVCVCVVVCLSWVAETTPTPRGHYGTQIDIYIYIFTNICIYIYTLTEQDQWNVCVFFHRGDDNVAAWESSKDDPRKFRLGFDAYGLVLCYLMHLSISWWLTAEQQQRGKFLGDNVNDAGIWKREETPDPSPSLAGSEKAEKRGKATHTQRQREREEP